MSSAFSPKVITANDLVLGDVVYLSVDGQWVRQHTEAELFLDADRANECLGFAQAQHGQVVGVYLADAVSGIHGPAPVHFREGFRARGPSNFFHGKQSEQNNVSV